MSKAEELYRNLDNYTTSNKRVLVNWANDASAELRRLSAINAELLEALKDFVENIEFGAKVSGTEGYMHECANKARAAIAKAQGDQ